MRFAIFIIVLVVMAIIALYVMGDQQTVPQEQIKIDVELENR